jgi:hypothetical protein
VANAMSKTLYPPTMSQNFGWAPGPVQTGAEKLPLCNGIRSSDYPARSDLLYRLHYPGPLFHYQYNIKLKFPLRVNSENHSKSLFSS